MKANAPAGSNGSIFAATHPLPLIDSTKSIQCIFGQRRLALAGLVSRKERWGLTLRGWLCFLAGCATLFILGVVGIHPFLAVNQPTPSGYLVVEGWIPEYAVAECAETFNGRGYQKVLTVGGPVSGAHLPADDDDTHAYVAARCLEKSGMNPRYIAMVPNHGRQRDRTYGSALAAREWFSKQGIAPDAITVATLGIHARRSRLLFQGAFGPHTTVGTISIKDREYDPDRWWQYSEGLKQIVSEGASYVYACLFRPSA